MNSIFYEVNMSLYLSLSNSNIQLSQTVNIFHLTFLPIYVLFTYYLKLAASPPNEINKLLFVKLSDSSFRF